MTSGKSGVAPWRKHDGVFAVALDIGVTLLGLTLCLLICRRTFSGTTGFLVWSSLSFFYFVFYVRIVHILYWSWDTLRYLRRRWSGAVANPETRATAENLPLFHVLIASYESAESIGPVIRALANQDYPPDKLHIWVICERSERLKKEQQARLLIEAAANLGTVPSGAVRRFLWRCESRNPPSLEAWVEAVTHGNLRALLSSLVIRDLALEDLLVRLLHAERVSFPFSSETLRPLGLTPRQRRHLTRELRRIEATIQRIGADFARLLGSDEIYRRADLELEFVRSALRKRKLRKLARELFAPFALPVSSLAATDSITIERAARQLTPSTQDVVQHEIERHPESQIHLLDPHNRGFKPGALNFAYREIRKLGLLAHPEDTWFLVIDSDSLLPREGLRTVAEETRRDGQQQTILQMASIPTANFFAEGWFSKFISFADALGAVGKWARSTRRQLKPDLHAGSGVVVPATLTEFVDQLAGSPWDESTLTEDARLIIGQFGLMNGARNKTTMVPIFLLEAVPNQPRFWDTYRSFWQQRRRWATGGWDEFHQMRTAPTQLLFSRFDTRLGCWGGHLPTGKEYLAGKLRQLGRVTRWTLDHFWWGLGGFIILTHWWLVSLAVAAPSLPVAGLGLAALLLMPLVCLLTSASQLAWFIPGGLSLRRLCLLYLQVFVAIWLYCMPVVITQLACAFGFRRRYIEWKSTQKPRYQESFADVEGPPPVS